MLELMKTLILTVVALLLVTACAGGTKRSEVDHNDADIAFARDMIGHHEQAIEMSDLVEGANASPEVTALAEQIAAAQGPEIARMNDWLDDWDSGEMAGSVEHDGGHTAMPEGTGEAFDQSWLTLMIAHHEGAVEMARTQVEEGENPDAISLAEDIIASQSDEITTMKELLP